MSARTAGGELLHVYRCAHPMTNQTAYALTAAIAGAAGW